MSDLNFDRAKTLFTIFPEIVNHNQQTASALGAASANYFCMQFFFPLVLTYRNKCEMVKLSEIG